MSIEDNQMRRVIVLYPTLLRVSTGNGILRLSRHLNGVSCVPLSGVDVKPGQLKFS